MPPGCVLLEDPAFLPGVRSWFRPTLPTPPRVPGSAPFLCSASLRPERGRRSLALLGPPPREGLEKAARVALQSPPVDCEGRGEGNGVWVGVGYGEGSEFPNEEEKIYAFR